MAKMGPMGAIVRAVVIACALLPGLTAAASAGPDADHNRGFAQADATSLLASAQLPPDATAVDGEPAGDGGVLGGTFAPPSPELVTRTAWFQSASSANDVIAFIAAHWPAGTKLALNGSADSRDGHSYEFRGYSRPSILHELSWRMVTFTVAPLDSGGSGIRVDAQVVWVTPRAAAETIPPTASDLTLSGRRSVHISDPRRAHRVAEMLNALDVVQPGLVVCPDQLPAYPLPKLVFRARPAEPPLATAVVEPNGCAQAAITIGGRPMPALDLSSVPGQRLVKLLTELGLITQR